MCLDDEKRNIEFEKQVFNLIIQLKQLYYNRKVKAPKGKAVKLSQPVKKRYIVGLNEVFKNLKLNEVKMVILATDLEKVTEENGID